MNFCRFVIAKWQANCANLQQIRNTNDEEIEASLNQYISKINPEIWRKSGTNTNNAEAVHAMVINKKGKQLSLLSVISKLVGYNSLI
ncbi:hypothetical protein RhiirA4_480037 [Rhizophagus irregularis]|uniref:Uncharacterized protein n=1 Tax=Rhizophagus irregularis TaxID=588596 RepID=A0A2I1HHB5_9GLOM|nr:hypothetical protein RhiirA4_480037 [Rhizophagus irregularis]